MNSRITIVRLAYRASNNLGWRAFGARSNLDRCSQSSWKSEAENIFLWLIYFLEIVRAQAMRALELIQQDRIENLLSEKQLALWRWAQSGYAGEFSRKDAVEALGFPPSTVEAIIKKLLDLKRLQRIGEGRSTRYRVQL